MSKTIAVRTARGQTALDVLRARGVLLASECGGRGTCGTCRLRVLAGGFASLTEVERALLSEAERAAGTRLACRLRGAGTVRVREEGSASRTLSLAGDRTGDAAPRYGVAIDLGTTTLRLSLLDFANGERLGAVQALNAQAGWGADVMTRMSWALEAPEHARRLAEIVRGQLSGEIEQLAQAHHLRPDQVERVAVVGNTAMTHLLTGTEVEPLALFPYASPLEGRGALRLAAADWGWNLAPGADCVVLPVLRSFVGSDLLADLIQVGMGESGAMTLLLDLGTNGEVALGNREIIWCASAAAGCAFEATSLRCGVGARPGAVWRVRTKGDAIRCDTLEDEPPIGFCGSGALSALALLRQQERLQADGRIAPAEPSHARNGDASVWLTPRLHVTQDDVRQIQLAKGAIAAATGALLDRAGVRADRLERVVLIGNFGRNLDVPAALALGLLPPVPAARVEVCQEATLLGAERALCRPETLRAYERLAAEVAWVSLVELEDFADRFAAGMRLSPQEAFHSLPEEYN